MTCHPLAALFPLMEGKAFDEFCEDIKKRGQLVPITVQGKVILDGRNRARACEKLGKMVQQVQFETLDLPISPEEFIWSMNIERRHLDANQLAAIAQQWRPQYVAEGMAAKVEGGKTAGKYRPSQVVTESTQPEKRKPTTRARLAKLAGVSQHKIAQAEIVAKDSPELLEEVKAGKVTLTEAVRQTTKTAAPSKRKAIVENAAQRTMINILSQIRGMCRALNEINMPALCEACTGEEAATWAKTARESARNLRAFASMLEQKGNGENENVN